MTCLELLLHLLSDSFTKLVSTTPPISCTGFFWNLQNVSLRYVNLHLGMSFDLVVFDTIKVDSRYLDLAYLE